MLLATMPSRGCWTHSRSCLLILRGTFAKSVAGTRPLLGHPGMRAGYPQGPADLSTVKECAQAPTHTWTWPQTPLS
eukprot:44788-Pelagomonas_calceolata.AAC.3